MKQLSTITFFFLVYSNTIAQVSNKELNNSLLNHSETNDLPGFAVAVVSHQDVIFQKAYGLSSIEHQTAFSPHTIINLGSVSKTFVGVALVKAIDEGFLSMDDPINKYLRFEINHPFSDEPILIKHLSDHTSSIRDSKHYGKTYLYDDNFTTQENQHEGYLEFIKSHEKLELSQFVSQILSKKGKWYAKKNFLKTEPGEEREYSNLNAALVAIIIENGTGIPFSEFCKSRIFEPLRMANTTWTSAEINHELMATRYFPASNTVPGYKLITYPDGGLYSNLEDLSKYLQAIIGAYSGNENFLSSKACKLLLPGDDDDYRAFWGMGEVSRNIGHRGSDPGVQTDLQFNADSKIGRIVLCNVNAEDDQNLMEQYSEIHKMVSLFEKK